MAVKGVSFYGGLLLVLHGSDQIVKGSSQILTNQKQKSVTTRIIEEFGASPELAENIDDLLGAGGGLVAGSRLLMKMGDDVLEVTVKELVKEGGEKGPTVVRGEVKVVDKSDFKPRTHFKDGDLGKKVDSNAPMTFKKEEVCLKKLDLHKEKLLETTPVWDMNSIIAKEFESGGSWVIAKDKYDLYIRNMDVIGTPDGQFMISSKAMDRVLLETNHDAIKLEELLGLSNLQGKKLYRIDVKNPLDYNPRLPHKGLSGANEHFIEGGHTKGGIPEIVTDTFPRSQIKITEL